MISSGIGSAYWNIRGLSTDIKPTDEVPNGSLFTEIDTGNEYLYDEANATWYLKAASGGGGGGGATIVVDTVMSDTSANAVQNKVIKEYVDTSLANYTTTTEFTQAVDTVVDAAVDTAVDEAIADKLTGVTEEQMNSLFPELYP